MSRYIDEEDAIAIVRVIILHHFSRKYNSELKKEVLSEWDKKLFIICNEICAMIRIEAKENE